MSSLFHLNRRAAAVIFAIAASLAVCHSESLTANTPDLDAEIARASNLRQPVLVLVIESGLSRADDRARALFEKAPVKDIVPVLLDISNSRNRATATRFHVTKTPLLLSLSPMGLIVTRDEKPLSKVLLRERIADVEQKAPYLDSEFRSLKLATITEQVNPAAELAIADFLLAHQNAREAIFHLGPAAFFQDKDTVRRIRAWVELARAHLWIAEPEKGRHEANDLIATLGPKFPEARSGGNLVLGMQDTNGKRFSVARREFETAIAAAPDSEYAKQAAEALAKLPGESK
jgi:hypothetical protein